MKGKIIDLGMHPYADTFISKDQLIYQNQFSSRMLSNKRILKLTWC